MKRKIVVSVIFGTIFIVLLCTLFFTKSIEIFLKLKPNFNVIEEDAFEVHFIDVGQGDAIAIRFPNDKTMLVDSGPRNGEDNLREYLEKVFFKDNYNTFDYVVLTHSDIDHSGNMEFILDNYKINNFFRPSIFSSNLEPHRPGLKVNNECYDKILDKLKLLEITTYYSTDGAVINTGNGEIRMYLPNDLLSIEETNDYCPILIISANDNKVCLSGDLGEDYENEIINRNVLPDVDLFKLAHHGSKYSNSYEFLNEIKPEYIACSVGENTYGHPSSDVLLRIANYSEESYRNFKSTLKDGNIIYYVNENDMEILTIKDVGQYLFLDWYVVVIFLEGVLVINYLIIVIPKKKLHINKHMKNMKQ